MAENKQNEEQTQEIDRSGIDFRSDADTAINSNALSNQGQDDDQASLVDAMGQNPFKLSLIRTFIKVKNHISIIPMILVVITLIILTVPIQVHVNAFNALSNDSLNAFWFFINIILSLIITLSFININSKKTQKTKWIIMMVVFYIAVICSGLIDILYLRDIGIEVNLVNNIYTISTENLTYINNSKAWMTVHLVFLIIDAALAALCPILQPFCKKLHINIKKKEVK